MKKRFLEWNGLTANAFSFPEAYRNNNSTENQEGNSYTVHECHLWKK